MYFTKKQRAANLYNPRFRIHHFQTLAWKCYLQIHLLAKRLMFWGWWWISCKRDSRPFNGTDFASWIANFFSFFTSAVYAYSMVSQGSELCVISRIDLDHFICNFIYLFFINYDERWQPVLERGPTGRRPVRRRVQQLQHGTRRGKRRLVPISCLVSHRLNPRLPPLLHHHHVLSD